MDRATISRIEGWESRPVSGGYVGLNELADEEFTGAVSAGGAYLFMLNGRVVGVEDGTVSTFEDADATAYQAPDPALPLLFAMRGRGGEVRGSYYTDDTPIGEVDQTLTEGGFTGYLELSENVLSGDYYVVYYGGRSLAAAFVGNKGRVVTGDEAFQLAADEVGIYEVTAVDLDVAEVPEAPEAAVAAASVDTTDSEPDAEESPDEEDEAASEPEEPTTDDVEEDAPASEPAVAEAEPADEEDDGAEILDAEDDDDAVTVPDTEDGTDDAAAAVPDAEAGNQPAEAATGGSAAEASADVADATAASQPSEPPRREGKPVEPDERFEEEARWREARTVPALDPEDSERPAEEREVQEPEPPAPSEPTPTERSSDPDEDDEAVSERLSRLEAQIESSERERERLDRRLEEVVDERDALEAERDELAERVTELEGELQAAKAEAASAAAGATDSGQSSGGGQRVDPTTALDQTDLFVRYGSKSKPTLDSAHDGRASAEEVAENLRIDSHSRFDPATATVEGRPFHEFLEDTIQYRFVSWLVEVLLYEIRETGTEAGLRDLYDVLPEIDRAEFNGTVTATDEEGDQHSREFDVVCRNRMGKPLIVANINDSLDPATGDMMGTLVEDATEMAEGHGSVGAAFLVTASFFQPDALETAEDATRGGGFLSRESKKSFVKLSRSGGYHLCLVEARGDDFHVAVPEF